MEAFDNDHSLKTKWEKMTVILKDGTMDGVSCHMEVNLCPTFLCYKSVN